MNNTTNLLTSQQNYHPQKSAAIAHITDLKQNLLPYPANNNMTSPPQFFYRVQHQGSYTYYHPHTGFEARGHYKMDPSHYINGSKVRSHLKWADRPIEPTPFISVFDNYGMVST